MKRIVIVEDDAAISDILRIILEREGYEVDEYLDGSPIMENIARWPDLFLIDKQLSGVDGLDICKHLKQQPETNQIPVIIISATPGLQNLVKEAGADSFIEKPFSRKVLLNTIQELTE